jgi:hypothetical protein
VIAVPACPVGREILFALLRGRKDCNEKRSLTPKWLISKNLIIELRLLIRIVGVVLCPSSAEATGDLQSKYLEGSITK